MFTGSGYSKSGAFQINSGDTGALWAVGGPWQGEPALTRTDANGVALMDFATTFAPGDNFRLTASVNGERDSAEITDADFYFAPEDIESLQLRVSSP